MQSRKKSVTPKKMKSTTKVGTHKNEIVEKDIVGVLIKL